MNIKQNNFFWYLTYHFKSKESRHRNFIDFDCPLYFLRNIRDCDKTIEQTKKYKKRIQIRSNRNSNA